MPVEQNEILPNIAKRMSLNRFFAVQRDIVNDELEALVPDLIEDALENPTGTYQRTSKSMSYQMTTIDRTTKSIKEDTVEILRFLNKDLMSKLDNIEAGGGGGSGLLGGLATLLGGLGLGTRFRSLLSRLKGGAATKPPARPGSGPPRRGGGPQFRVSDLPPRVQQQMYEQGRRSSQFISDDLARRHGLVNQYSQYGQGQKLTRFMITPKQLAIKMLGKVDAVASKLSVPLAAGLEAWDGLNEYLQVRASYEAGMLTKDQYANEINRILAKYPARFLGGLAASMMGGYWGQSLFSGKVGKFFGGVVGGALGYTVGSTLSGYAVDLLMGDETIGSVLKKEYDVDLNRTATPEQTKQTNPQYQNQVYNYTPQQFSETLQKMETEKGFKATAQTQYMAGMVGGAPPHMARAAGSKTVTVPSSGVNPSIELTPSGQELSEEETRMVLIAAMNSRTPEELKNGEMDEGRLFALARKMFPGRKYTRLQKIADEVRKDNLSSLQGSGAYLAARQMAKAAEGAPAGIMGPSYASLTPATMTDAGGYGTSPLGFGPLAGAPAGGGSGTGAASSAPAVSAGPMGFAVPTTPRTATETGTTRSVSAPQASASATPTAYGSNSFVDMLAELESNNRNIPSEVDPDTAGPGSRSQGYFQIGTPTWQDFAPKAGVDLSKYPNAMSAPRSVQEAVARKIPLRRFGPRTRKHLMAKFGKLNLDSTIGELASPYETAPVQTPAEQPTATQESSTLSSGFVSPVSGTFQENASNVYGAPRGSYAKGGSKQSGPKTRRHSGSDWRAADGSETVSPVNGTVIHTGRHSGYGGMIDIMGDDGNVYRLAPHGKMKNLKPGQKINQGDVVGTIAQRHLHFEVIPPEINGRPNPVWQEFKSKLDSGKGGFVATSNQRGTVDPAAALGIQSGQKVSAGQSWKMDQAAKPVPEVPQAVQSTMDNTRAAPDRIVPEAIEEPDTVKEDIREMRREQKSFLELQRSSDAGRATTVEPVATLADMSQTQYRPQNSPAIMRQKAAAQGIMMANFGGYNVLDATSLPPSGETGIIS